MLDAQDLRTKVAVSCRILGMLGLVRESTGHVSARIPGTDEMWIRCRGGNELGLTFTGLHNIRRLDFDGNGRGLGSEHAVPHEVLLHGEIYRARKDVQAVVHAHPYYALMCGMTNLEYRPIFGGYEPSAVDIVVKGVPVFPRAVTVTSKELAADMLKSMGNRDVLLMKGHGITVTADSVEAATCLAIRFDRLSKIMWEVALSGREAPDIAPEDLAKYAGRAKKAKAGWDTTIEGSELWTWKHYVKTLETSTIGLPDDL